MEDALWSALADPHRRAMLDLIRREGGCTVGALSERLGTSQPATSKHLRVLRQAGLVQVHKAGTRRIYTLEPQTLVQLDAWLEPYRRLWNDSLDALGDHLDTIDRPDSAVNTGDPADTDRKDST
ncbi:ArsR/SmtB family transcription factor [Rhodococcus sp. NPDC058639]|uniref:ArsR/SmtB family transcription factor n=1 Tax=Rhodococcus sp. NPDC058639 TaxID=3346570 RepID=UPI003667A136